MGPINYQPNNDEIYIGLVLVGLGWVNKHKGEEKVQCAVVALMKSNTASVWSHTEPNMSSWMYFTVSEKLNLSLCSAVHELQVLNFCFKIEKCVISYLICIEHEKHVIIG